MPSALNFLLRWEAAGSRGGRGSAVDAVKELLGRAGDKGEGSTLSSKIRPVKVKYRKFVIDGCRTANCKVGIQRSGKLTASKAVQQHLSEIIGKHIRE